MLSDAPNLTIPTNPLGQIRSSWTDGNTFDTVVRDVDPTPGAAAPGKNIDLTGRGEIENFLIIAHVDTSGQSIQSGEGNDYIYAMAGADNVNGMGGNDFIDGGTGNDLLSGSSGNDTIWGNAGSDTIFGGAGDDFIFFDAGDQAYGNAGFDVARYQQTGDHSVLVIDMGAREIEVLITGNKADRVIASGNGPLLVSTGNGSDHITFQNGRGAPTIVIGGSGRDTYNVEVDADSDDPVGILKIKVLGLTNDNLPHLTLDMLGMPADFDWSQIDLVMINCDGQDRVAINGTALQTETVSGDLIYQWTDTTTGETHTVPVGTLTETLFQQVVEGEDFTKVWDRQVGSISSDFLNGTAQVFAPRIGVISEMVVEYRDSEGRSFIHGEAADEILYDHDLSGAVASSGWFDWGYGARAHYFETPGVDPYWQPGSWFIYGGGLGTDGVITSNLTASLPPDF